MSAAESQDSFSILQISDTHFLEDGHEAEGGGAYDTTAAAITILEHCQFGQGFDAIVATGDIADHGRPAQYARAVESLDRFVAPVYACPGNHDRHATFPNVESSTISLPRRIDIGNWTMLFVDSNSGTLVAGPDGEIGDTDDVGDRLHGNGALSPFEIDWITSACAGAADRHVFVWVHHPPAPTIKLSFDPDYAETWGQVLAANPNIVGIGAGHTHVPAEYEFHGRRICVGPSFKHNFDLEANTTLPPGYRTYEFYNDGTFSTSLHLADDQRWPRKPLGRAIQALFAGEITYEQLDEIIARKAAQA